MTKVSINVSTAASAVGLKKDLDIEARKRGFKLSRLVADTLAFALANKNHFQAPLNAPRERGGQHVSTTVTTTVRFGLNEWAEERKTHRSNLVSFILEKALEDNLFEVMYAANLHLDDQDEDEG